MEKAKKHKRYKEFSLKVGDDKKTESHSTIDIGIIFFVNDYKLRSHAVKHLTNSIDFENIWKNVLSKDIRFISNIISALKAIDCPFFELNYETPPCHKCHSYKDCTRYVSSLETEYLEGINQFIIQTGILPRYAVYNSNNRKMEILSVLSDSRVVLKACQIEGNIFNLMTCYAKNGLSFFHILRKEVSKIESEADNKNILWCNSSNWAIGLNIEDKKKSKNPYRRAGGDNWKQYLEGCKIG